jgi:hypothetical protein
MLKKKAIKFKIHKEKKSDLQEIKEDNTEFSSTSNSDTEFDPEY